MTRRDSSLKSVASTDAIAEKQALEIDPVCGMQVDSQAAVASYEYRGKAYFFCSQSCLKKFRAGSEEHLTPQATTPVDEGRDSHPQPAHADDSYTCPMHPEVRQNGPGSCPKCGMALEQMTRTALPYLCRAANQFLQPTKRQSVGD